MNNLIAILMLCATVGLAADSTVMDGDWSSVAGGMFYRPVQWSSVAGGMFYATSAAATSAPPSYIYPTNGQSLAGLVPYNWGSAGNGTNFGGVYTNRAPGIGAFLNTHKTNAQFSASWMNGATQLTILAWVQAPGQELLFVGRGRGAEWKSEYKGINLGPPGHYYSFNSQGSVAYNSAPCGISKWTMLGYQWSSAGTITGYSNGVYRTPVGTVGTIPTSPISTVDIMFTVGHGDGNNETCWYSDIFATTNTITLSDITNWYYQTATATYNSNWPSLFTGDVEVTWREYVP